MKTTLVIGCLLVAGVFVYTGFDVGAVIALVMAIVIARTPFEDATDRQKWIHTEQVACRKCGKRHVFISNLTHERYCRNCGTMWHEPRAWVA